MKKIQTLETINEGLKEIMKESFDWCKSDDHAAAQTAVRINQKAHDLQKLLEKLRAGCFEE
jgi:uncharacterized protein YktB (UPF0637 family)